MTITNKNYLFNRKAMTLKAGYTQTTLAKYFHLTPGAITHVFNGATRNRELQEKIVALLGVSLAEFWPEQYGQSVVNCVAGENDQHNTPPSKVEKNLTETRA
jgi:lambda repressor-like predicted transcriptional regulator